MWKPCDLYRCANTACKSEVLVLRSPLTNSPFIEPRCICGHALERVPYGPDDPLRHWSF